MKTTPDRSPFGGVPSPERTPTLANRKGPTARDVARLAGVSQSTVSRVINDTGTNLISLSTYQRVRDAATQLGYSPHPLARALRGKNTQLLGLIVREIEDPFFAKFIATLNVQARALGYQIVLGHSQSDPNQALQMTTALDLRHCDGVLLLGDLRDDGAATEQIVKINQAVVALCRGCAPSLVPTINGDNAIGMGLLLDHLYNLGHRWMAFLNGGWLGDIRDRREIFLEFTRTRQLPFIPEHVQTDSNDLDGGYRSAQRLLALPERPTALLAADDVMAIGALKAAAESGLRVPDDLSITGFDDIEMARFTSPSLTTVRQPVEAMSQRALDWLMRLIRRELLSEAERAETVPPELVVRQSTGPAPHPRAGEPHS